MAGRPTHRLNSKSAVCFGTTAATTAEEHALVSNLGSGILSDEAYVPGPLTDERRAGAAAARGHPRRRCRRLFTAAAAVVAQAVLGMERNPYPDRARATVAVAAAVLALAMPSTLGRTHSTVESCRAQSR
jgi:hypothetical protein